MEAQLEGRARYVAREVPLLDNASIVVTALAVDSLGYLYVGTGGGLLRFDGRRIVRWSVAEISQLESNRVAALAVTPQGVWVGTPEGRLLLLEAGRVRDSLTLPRPDKDGAWGIDFLPDGTPAVRTDSWVGLRKDGRWLKLPWDESAGAERAPTELLVSRSGQLLVGTTNGLRVFDGATLRVVHSPARSAEGLEPVVRGLANGTAGDVWVATSAGLMVLRADGILLPVEHLPEMRGSVASVIVDDQGVLWVGGSFGLVAARPRVDRPRIELELEHVVTFEWGDGVPRFLASNGRGSIVAANGNGGNLLVVTRSPVRVLGARDGLPQPYVHNLQGDGAGGLWVSTTCEGVTHFAVDGVRRYPKEQLGLSNGCVRSMLRDSLGTLWLGTGRQLSRITPSGELRVVRVVDDDGIVAGAMLPDGQGGVWLGLRPGGVRHVPRDGPASEAPLFAAVEPNPVWSLVRDARGTIWVGQVGTLTRVDGSAVRIFGLQDSVPPGPIRAILPDPDGTLWLATYGGGLARLRDGRIQRLTTRDGLFDDALSAILADDRGRLWLMGNRGVSAVRRSQLDSVFARRARAVDALTLGSEVGVPEGNGGFPAGWSDGRRFFFASVDGVTIVDPARLDERREAPRPVIEALVTPDGEPPLAADAVVPAGVRGTALRVTAPALDGRALRFRYRVEGRREGWVDLGPERLLPLDALVPGRHPIEVAVRDEWGAWSAQPAEIVVEVRGRWWQGTLFRVLLLGLVLAAGAAIMRARIAAAEARALELRREIARRERAEAEAQARLHDLAHISRVAVAGELATSLAHELNQPLAAIVSNADAARRMLVAPVGAPGSGENVDDVLRDISSEGKRASGVIRTLREFLRRGAGDRRAVDLAEAIGEVLPVLRHLLERERVTVVVHGTVGLPRVMGDRIALQQVLMNLIVNAVEAMRDTPPELRLIEIRGHVADGEVVLGVRDSGPGVEPARREEVFRPFATTKPGGMGMGLAISRSIAESHDGDLEVHDAEGGGAEFRLRLPVAPQ